MGDGVHFPLSSQGPYLADSCAHCHSLHSLYELSCVSPLVSEDTASSVSSVPSAFTVFLLPPRQGSLSPEGKDLMEASCLGLSLPKSLSLCTLSSWIPIFVAIYCRRNPL